MTTLTPALMNSRTNYSIDTTVLGYLMDDAINYVNLEAGTSISNLAAGSVTVTANEAAVLVPLITLLMRAYDDRGPNVNVGAISISTLASDPQYSLHMKLLTNAIKRLSGRSFERV